MKDLVLALSRQQIKYTYMLCVSIVFLVAIFDFWIGVEVATAFFYIIPTVLVACRLGRKSIISIVLISLLVWFVIDYQQQSIDSSKLVPIWNLLTRLSLFMFVGFLIHELRIASIYYEQLAEIDELTGLLNRRGFYARLSEELDRARRYKRPFSIAYVDLDNFKALNDRLGHKAGDELLRTVADTLKVSVRITDQVARVGGDEFVVLLVETDQKEVQVAFDKCFGVLSQKLMVSDSGVSMSVGVVTFKNFNISLLEVVEKADTWMYKVKKSGKNRVEYHVDIDQSVGC